MRVGTRPLLRFSLAASDHFLLSPGRRQLWLHSWQPSRPRPRRGGLETLLRGLTSWAQGSSPPQLHPRLPEGLPRPEWGWGGGRLAGPWNSLSAKQQTLTWGSTWAESASSNFHGGCGPSPGPLPRQPDPSPSPALGTSAMDARAAREEGARWKMQVPGLARPLVSCGHLAGCLSSPGLSFLICAMDLSNNVSKSYGKKQRSCCMYCAKHRAWCPASV